MNTCSFCQLQGEQFFKCSRCKQAQYCNENCQKSHWKTHKQNCEGPPKDPPQPISIDHFKDLKLIGQGNFSEIFKAKCRYRQKFFAIKRFSKFRLKQLNKEADVRMEVHVLQKLDGKFITKIYDHWHDELYMYICMELLENGDLNNLVSLFGLPSEKYVKLFSIQILNSLEYLQDKGIVHRDLKPENIMLTEARDICLIDFGTARDLQDKTIKGSGNGRPGRMVYEHYVGTPQYMPQEMIRNKDSNFQSDIWSFGVVLYQLICGDWPFKGASEYLIFKQILESEVQFPDGIFTDEQKDLISFILKKDYKERPSIKEIKNHSFFLNIDINQQFSSIVPTEDEKIIYRLRKLGLQQKFETIQQIDEFYNKQDLTILTDLQHKKLNWIKKRLADYNQLNQDNQQQIINEEQKYSTEDLKSESEGKRSHSSESE